MENNETVYIMCEQVTAPEDMRCDVINESTIDVDGKQAKSVTIDTCLQSFEVKNWNGRIYGADVVMDGLNNDGMIQNDIRHGQWVGEYGHPLDTDPKRQVVFDPMRISHRILSYRKEGNLLLGNVQTLVGGAGDMLCGRILQGMPAAFSLRSLGTIDLATRRVKSPLKILTYDSVIRPSHIEAYQKEIISESTGVESVMNESVLFAPINESMDEITSFIKTKSSNISKIAEMFKLDKLNLVLTENGRVNMIIDEGTVVNVPIESAINLQYSDILSNSKMKRRSKS